MGEENPSYVLATCQKCISTISKLGTRTTPNNQLRKQKYFPTIRKLIKIQGENGKNCNLLGSWRGRLSSPEYGLQGSWGPSFPSCSHPWLRNWNSLSLSLSLCACLFSRCGGSILGLASTLVDVWARECHRDESKGNGCGNC